MWCSGAGDWGSSRTCTLCTNWQPIDRQCNRGRLERALSKQHRARHAQHCDSKNVPPRDLGRKACAAAPRPTFTPHSRQSWAAPLKASPGRCVLPFRGAPPQSPLTPQSAPSRQLPPPAPSQPPLPSLLFLSAPPRSPPRAVCATSRALPLDRLAPSTTPEPDRCANGPRRGVSAAGSGSSRPSRRVLEPVPDAPAWGARPRPQPVSRPSSSGRTVCEAERGRGAGGRACRRA